MRYLTKRWYRLGQNVFEDAEINPRAAAFSETYYQELYTQKLMEFLDPDLSESEDEDESGYDYDPAEQSFYGYDELPEDDLPEFEYQTWVEIGSWTSDANKESEDRDSSGDEHDKDQEIADGLRQAMLSQLNQLSEQDLDGLSGGHDIADGGSNADDEDSEDDELRAFAEDVENFEEILRMRMDRLTSSLPEDLQEEIADLRILALGEASPDVKARLDDLAEDNREAVERALIELNEVTKEAFGGRTPDIVKQLNLHDCRVTNIEWDGEELVLDLDNSGGFTNICRTSFHKIALLELDGPLTDAYFVALEIYPHIAGYEIHAMLQSENSSDPDGLMYFTLLAESVEAVSTKIRTRRM